MYLNLYILKQTLIMKIIVVSRYKNGSEKPNVENSITVDKNTKIYDLRTVINKSLGVKAHYQLISDCNRIMLNGLQIKDYIRNDIGKIYRIILSDETPIDISSTDEECNASGSEYVKFVQSEELKAVNRANFLRETYKVKEINKDSSNKIELDKSYENKYNEQLKQLRSMGYIDEIVLTNILNLTNGNLEKALYYLSPDS